MNQVPHVIPYQGSKRNIADKILSHVRLDRINTLYEPFAGSAAITLAAASRNLAWRYVIGEKLEALAKLWKLIIEEPEQLVEEYSIYWNEQLDDPKKYYFRTREQFNEKQTPSALFYLIARCVKNAIRFNPSGEFNQAPDNRRLGMKPSKLRREAIAASRLLRGRTEVVVGDYKETISMATTEDLIYMDPPWRGLSRNPRYAFLLDADEFIDELHDLNERRIPFLLSFDGSCGNKSYIDEMPADLKLIRVPIKAGRSSQATLLGRNEITVESLYISPA